MHSVPVFCNLQKNMACSHSGPVLWCFLSEVELWSKNKKSNPLPEQLLHHAVVRCSWTDGSICFCSLLFSDVTQKLIGFINFTLQNFCQQINIHHTYTILAVCFHSMENKVSEWFKDMLKVMPAYWFNPWRMNRVGNKRQRRPTIKKMPPYQLRPYLLECKSPECSASFLLLSFVTFILGMPCVPAF